MSGDGPATAAILPGGDQAAPAELAPAELAPAELAPAELARAICELADDRKAQDIVELDMRGVLGYTDYFVIVSGLTDRQTRAIHDAILFGLKHSLGRLPRRVEGLTQGNWILIDYLDVVVHIFTPVTRAFYRLEQLWGEAPARVHVSQDASPALSGAVHGA